MAKKRRVPLNRLVLPETFEAVKGLASELECSEGEVVDQAVTLLVGMRESNGTKRLISGEAVDLIPPSGGILGTITVDAEKKSATVNLESEVVVDNRPKNCVCRHCGQRYAGAKMTTICSECKSTGHTLAPADCPACNEGVAL